MRRALLLVTTLTGCGPGILDPILTTGVDSPGASDATAFETGEPPGATSTSGPPPSGPTSIPPGVTTDGCTFVCTSTTDDDSVFIMPGDPPAQCDVWDQDCPPGEKCSAAGPPPLGTDNIVCTAIVPGPDQLGEPCEVLVEGHFGPDTCDLGLYCHDVDPDSQKGTCRPLCTGNQDDPTCPLGQMCVNTSLPMCVDACDPLLATCEADDACLWFGHEFGCWPDGASPKGKLFEACEHVDQCEGGLMCSDPAIASECSLDGVGCCVPFCDLDGPDTCPGVGQGCEPFYPNDTAPAGLEHLGVCFLP